MTGTDRRSWTSNVASRLQLVRAEAPGVTPELAAAARRLVEEIAGMQYLLRNVFRLAIEAQGAREQIRLGEIYSSDQGGAKKNNDTEKG